MTHHANHREAPGPTRTAKAAAEFMGCVDNATHLGVLRTRAILGGWAAARQAGLWDDKQSDAVATAALDAVLDLLRQWGAEAVLAAAPGGEQ